MKLIHDIHRGKNPEENCKKYKELVVETYPDYAALELTFSAFTMLQEIEEEKTTLAIKEKDTIEDVLAALGALGKGEGGYESIASRMKEIRESITGKMDLFTAYTDRLICYEYVLNRMEYKYLSEKECNQKLAAYGEERFMQELLTYLFGSNDQSLMKDKLRIVTGQLPVHMTKNKLFEKIKEAFTLYKGGEKAALQDFVYMLRTSAMVYEPAKSVGEYPAFEEALSALAGADYANLSKEQWEELTEVLRDCTEAIHEITDFYYSLQKVVNSIYALCVALPYQESESKLMGASKSIWCCLGKREYMDEMLVPLEGKIEVAVEKTGHLSAVFYEIQESYKEELASWGLDEFFTDFTLVLNLLSDSLFIDLDKKVQNEMADDNDVMACAEQFINELSVKLSEVSRPVKKAIMSQVLEKLPMLFRNTEEVQEYIRVNLFGCQDKAEKAIVMELLQDLIREEQEW